MITGRSLDLKQIFHEKVQKVFCFIGPAFGSSDPILWTTHTEACILGLGLGTVKLAASTSKSHTFTNYDGI